MDYYYPDRIADDDYDEEASSYCSSEIEAAAAGSGANPLKQTNNLSSSAALDNDGQPNNGEATNNNASAADGGLGDKKSAGNKGPAASSIADEDYNFSLDRSGHDTKPKNDMDKSWSGGSTKDSKEQEQQQQTSANPMVALIQNERNRRLGIQDGNNKRPKNANPAVATASKASSGGVLGRIGGWFGGGGGGGGSNKDDQSVSSMQSRRSSAPAVKLNHSHHGNASLEPRRSSEGKAPKAATYDEDDDNSSSDSSDDSSSSDDDSHRSQSSNDDDDSTKKMGDCGGEHLTPQERARARALRHLSNSCVDARRKSKTASYIRGLERLDLKRKEDRMAKELEVVEAEMNKDRGIDISSDPLQRHSLLRERERDAVSATASALVRELPRIQGADAGAGRGKNNMSGEGSFMTYDDYVDALNNDARAHSIDEDGNDIEGDEGPSLWDNKEAVDVYVTSLQSRLKEALERTRSLEKRLHVLEQAGDDIVSSLCEDLAEVTSHSNKAESRYIKKGKELQRKRRREELRHRGKVRQVERRIRKLEQKLARVSGGEGPKGEQLNNHFGGSDLSTVCSSTTSVDDTIDDENDEVSLEKKLSSIKAKNEQDKTEHEAEVEAIRRQCEQLKLRLSVARLVMEGDDNLREYIALLERMHPTTCAGGSGRQNVDDIPEYSELHGPEERIVAPSPPPSRITRARAKLLKVTHLEQIYEQRLAVSKAFTDATINALEEELSDRETESQKMEVRCLNDLMLIDSEMKDSAKESNDKLEKLEREGRELEDAIAAFLAQQSIASVSAMFGGVDGGVEPMEPTIEETSPVDDESLSEGLVEDEEDIGAHKVDTSQILDDVVSEFEGSKPLPQEATPVAEQSFSNNIEIREKDESEASYTEQLSDADSSQPEIDVAKPAAPSNNVALAEPILIDDESSTEQLIGEKDDKSHAETGLESDDDLLPVEKGAMDEASFRDAPQDSANLVKREHLSSTADSMDSDYAEGKASVESGVESDAESLQAANDVGEEDGLEERKHLLAATDADSMYLDSEKAKVEFDQESDAESSHTENDVANKKLASGALQDSADLIERNPLNVINGADSTNSDNVGEEAQLETGVESDDESLQTANDVVDAVPGALRGSGDLKKRSSPPATMDANSIDSDSDYIGALHLDGSDRSQNDSPTPQHVQQIVDTENDFASFATPLEALETDSEDEIYVGSELSFNEQDETDIQHKELSEHKNDTAISDFETSKEMFVTNSSLVPNNQVGSHVEKNDELSAREPPLGDLAAIGDRTPEGSNVGKNEATSMLPAIATDSNRSGGIDNDQNVETTDNKEEERITEEDQQKKTVVEMLGRELECTLSEYQTSFDLSSSNERVHHLKKMNKLVSNIAKVHWGMECPNSNHAIGDSEMKGWSFKKSQRRSSDKEKQEKKKHRSKKDKKKKRRRHGKEKKGKEFQNSEGPHDQVLESSMLW